MEINKNEFPWPRDPMLNNFDNFFFGIKYLKHAKKASKLVAKNQAQQDS